MFNVQTRPRFRPGSDLIPKAEAGPFAQDSGEVDELTCFGIDGGKFALATPLCGGTRDGGARIHCIARGEAYQGGGGRCGSGKSGLVNGIHGIWTVFVLGTPQKSIRRPSAIDVGPDCPRLSS